MMLPTHVAAGFLAARLAICLGMARGHLMMGICLVSAIMPDIDVLKAIAEDWRKQKAWQPGWEYILE